MDIYNDGYKEVLFGEYCNNCAYFEVDEDDPPCSECLEEPVNLYSHVPVKWEEST